MPLPRYLDHHAEPEIKILETLRGSWPFALVIPAYQETPDFLQRLPSGGLVIVVANRPESDDDTTWFERLRETLPSPHWQQATVSLHKRSSATTSDILLVDRCLKGAAIPKKQGVGLARKIGCDIACQLIHTGQIEGHWIGTSDADTQLPQSYGEALRKLPTYAAACVFPFQHTVEDTPEWAIRSYELHMLYYVSGLRHAGSPYAWPTIGSCIALNSAAYAQAHGFPKRAGGEDFYLLNKLAKLGGVVHTSQPVIRPSARLSERVPFGTGPALQRYCKLDSSDQLTSYNPHSFYALRAVLLCLRQRAHNNHMSLKESAQTCKADHSLLQDLWQQFGCEKAIEKARQNSRTGEQCERHLMTWFDGFKTLKWIHACRDYYPDIQLMSAIESANWLTDFHREKMELNRIVEQLQKSLASDQCYSPDIVCNEPAKS